MVTIPNWCANSMIVKGNGKDVKTFIKENFRSNAYGENKDKIIYELDFEQFDPTPLDENGGIINDWYNWRLEHWGCKWSACGDQIINLEVDIDGEENRYYDLHTDKDDEMFSEDLIDGLDDNSNMKLELQCYYDTPWGPPEGIFMQWYEKYKELDLEVSLKFYEPGMVFAGELWFSKDHNRIIYIDDTDRVEWVKYLLKEDWESVDWYIEECSDMIREMEDEKVAEQLVPKVTEVLSTANNEQAAVLIADIMDKYMKWLKESKQ